ncbi:MAG: transcription elongation factor GreA [Bdellovibrionota bacterium]
MSDKFPMTVRGYEALQVELKRLKSVERPNIIKAIAEARAHGDLSENAEYHAAKEKQGFIEGRINELEDKLSRAQVIDPTTLSGKKVVFGATVQLLDTENDAKVSYQIVGADEADASNGKISVTAPIARALMGRSVDDLVTVRTPKGEREYEIIRVEFK